MKCLLLFALMAAVETAFGTLSDPKMREIFDNCHKELKVPDQELINYLKDPSNPASATRGLKCELKCGLQKMGIFKGTEPIEAVFLEVFGKLPEPNAKPEELKKGFAKCKSEKGPDECETVYKVMHCLRNAGILLH